jgi:O-antigen ligase
MNNSIAIRRALLGDALYFLPKAGLFGFGLDSFSEMSCLHGYQIHNSFLQAFVEFGWGAGVALIILVVIPFWIFLRRRSVEPDMHFLLSCLAFATLLSMIYGQVSRDLALFLFLGSFANLTAPRKSALVFNAGP